MAIVFNCAECHLTPNLVGGDEIYPHRPDLHDRNFYLCICGAYVGCHYGTENALGSPAKLELRQERMKLHAIFDPLWQKKMKRGFSKRFARNSAYLWLAKEMNLSQIQCHISRFDKKKCEEALEILNKLKVSK